MAKYFGGRPKPPTRQELAAAELAEELRLQVARLGEEVEALRAERDVLLAERSHAARRAPAPPGARGDAGLADWLAASRLEPRAARVAC